MTIQESQSRRWKSKASLPPKPRPSDGPEVMQALKPHPGRRMSEKEFLDWVAEKARAEWVDGEVILMSPASNEHDEIQIWLITLLRLFCDRGDLGRVSGSDLFIRLSERPRRRLADVFFVGAGNQGKFEDNAFFGVPDLIVEIVSPESVSRDYREKFADYQAATVREYWIIDPLSRRFEAHELVRGRFRQIPEKHGRVNSTMIKGISLDPRWIWQKPQPKPEQLLNQMDEKRP